MKTPREIILERHRAAATKLEGIQPERLATFANPALTRRGKISFNPISLWEGFWREAVLPWRRTWAGLAVAWLAILTLNLANHVSLAPAANEMANTHNPQVQAELREQKELLVQLLEPSMPTDAVPPKTFGPRSEQKREVCLA